MKHVEWTYTKESWPDYINSGQDKLQNKKLH